MQCLYCFLTVWPWVVGGVKSYAHGLSAWRFQALATSHQDSNQCLKKKKKKVSVGSDENFLVQFNNSVSVEARLCIFVWEGPPSPSPPSMLYFSLLAESPRPLLIQPHHGNTVTSPYVPEHLIYSSEASVGRRARHLIGREGGEASWGVGGTPEGRGESSPDLFRS